MTEHLTPEEIARLSKYKLTGDELVNALAHIEDCEACRLRVQSPSKAEVFNQLFRNEQEDQKMVDQQNSVNKETATQSVGTGWLVWLKKLFLGKKCYL